MTRDAEGYWEGTSTQPFDEGNHYYCIAIDGVEVYDRSVSPPDDYSVGVWI